MGDTVANPAFPGLPRLNREAPGWWVPEPLDNLRRRRSEEEKGFRSGRTEVCPTCVANLVERQSRLCVYSQAWTTRDLRMVPETF